MTDEQKKLLYGADAAEWLRRWDADQPVWSIEMGGLGPGYEQCIQITAAEMVRWFLDNKADTADWADEDKWKATRTAIDEHVMAVPAVQALGLSGAQWGAALSLATGLYKKGPLEIMCDEELTDRRIQVMKTFPQGA